MEERGIMFKVLIYFTDKFEDGNSDTVYFQSEEASVGYFKQLLLVL